MKLGKRILSLLLCGALFAGNVLTISAEESGYPAVTATEVTRSDVKTLEVVETGVEDEGSGAEELEENEGEALEQKGEPAESQIGNAVPETRAKDSLDTEVNTSDDVITNLGEKDVEIKAIETETSAGASEKVDAANSFERIGNRITKYTGTGGSVTIPSWCTEISSGAFSGEIGITSVTIPSSVKVIAASAFSGCAGMTTLTISYGVEEIGRFAFKGTAISNLVIPDSVFTIGSYAFEDCSALKSVKLGDALVSIAQGLFSDCSSLSSVIVGYGIRSIGSNAFEYCGALRSISLPDLVQKISPYAFQFCTNLITLNMGNGVNAIDSWAFYGCTSLSNINWSSSLTTIGDLAFSEASITSLALPNKVTAVGLNAFSNCNNLKSVTLSENLTAISSGIFYKCTALQSVKLGGSVTSIENSAFEKCQSLTSINIPDSVISIGNRAFEGCKNLQSLTLGNGVTKLDSDAFSNCTSLQKLVISYNVTVIADNILSGSNNVTLYVHDDTYAMQWAQAKGLKYTSLDVFRPSPVGNLKAVSTGKGKVKLTWTASANTDGYLIYAQKNGKYGYCGMTTMGTAYTDNAALDTDYNFYWVFPYTKDGNGKMQPGGCTKYVFAKGVCAAVTNLKAASVTGGVTLTWTKSADAEGYLIYGKTSSGVYGYRGMTSGAAFTDKKASKNEYNFYWVFPYHINESGKMIAGGTSQYIYGKAR